MREIQLFIMFDENLKSVKVNYQHDISPLQIILHIPKSIVRQQ